METFISRRRIFLTIFALLMFLLIIALVILFQFVRYQEEQVGGYATAISTIAINLHERDFQQQPEMLHVLARHSNRQNDQRFPVEGVMLHAFKMDPTYRSSQYLTACDALILYYNRIAIAQACQLALKGEDSPRIRYVLSNAKQQYQGSYESQLFGYLSSLIEGDPKAKNLFELILHNVKEGGTVLMRTHWETVTSEISEWE